LTDWGLTAPSEQLGYIVLEKIKFS